MKHFENTLRFMQKNYIIAAPIFIALAIPALIGQSGAYSMMGRIRGLFSILWDTDTLRNPFSLLGAVLPVIFTVGAAGILGFFLRIAAMPSAAGMIKKGLAGNSVTWDDMIPMLKENFVQYLIYWIANLVVFAVCGIAIMILVLIFGALILVLKGFGVFLLIIVLLAASLALGVVMVLLTMWLPAMIIDNMNVVDAAKKSLEIVKKNFWTILGITILIGIGGGILSSIVSAIFGFIPVIGVVIAAAVSALIEILRMTFYFMYYSREAERADAV